MMSETSSKAAPSTTSTAPPTYTSTATKPSSGISLCLDYFRTAPGIIKLIEIVSIIFSSIIRKLFFIIHSSLTLNKFYSPVILILVNMCF